MLWEKMAFMNKEGLELNIPELSSWAWSEKVRFLLGAPMSSLDGAGSPWSEGRDEVEKSWRCFPVRNLGAAGREGRRGGRVLKSTLKESFSREASLSELTPCQTSGELGVLFPPPIWLSQLWEGPRRLSGGLSTDWVSGNISHYMFWEHFRTKRCSNALKTLDGWNALGNKLFR